MVFFSFLVRVETVLCILATLFAPGAAATAREGKSRSLRSQSTEPQAVVEKSMLVGSMGSMLQSEAEVMDPKSPKALLQQQVVGLNWLESVLEQNLDTMDTEAFREKIAKSRTSLEKDTTPATADMLGKMRTEMHEFSVPFFEDAVKEELEDIRARKERLLDKIMAVDAGETVDLEDDDVKEAEKKAATTTKKDKAPPKKDKGSSKKAKDDNDPEQKKRRRTTTNIVTFVMSLIGATLILCVLGITIKVYTHVPRGG